MLFKPLFNLLGLSLTLAPFSAAQTNLSGYEYIVVGSGAGGGPVAARLALAGHKTLLIEAGNDQGANVNYSVPAFQAKSTEDPALAWDFFVNHYTDESRQKRDYKLTYNTPGGGEYVGLNPPAGSTIKGILYPRTNTLGGCTAHNALVSIYPDKSDFQYIADLTGDTSWVPSNLRKYFVKMENNQYVALAPGHGYNGWFYTSTAPLTLALQDSYLLAMINGGAKALSLATGGAYSLINVLTGDANADTLARDQNSNIYQIPISSYQGVRRTVREFLLDTANAKDIYGNKKYPLDIRLNTHVTKVLFTKDATPRAYGVEFLDGKYLYRASPLAGQFGAGVKGTVNASREVIVAGGSYNTPQILKLSGVGPAAELQSFGIPVVADLPGVGANLQDHYEVAVIGNMTNDFPVLKGCTFEYSTPDACFDKYQANFLGDRGTYASSGFAAGIFYKSTQSADGNYDELGFGGPVNFRGYFPGYAYQAVKAHNMWSWALLKSHPRNRAGTVTLRSADPLDTPLINFNYFDTGSGDYNADLEAIYEAIQLARSAFANNGAANFTEELPGAQFNTPDLVKQHIKDTAWGHHCSSTAAIGADNDPMAVLDSSFRVRKVTGLRVVDASVYPRIPGTFTLTSTYLVGEKAADVILSQITK